MRRAPSIAESPRQADLAYQVIKADILAGVMPPGHQALEPDLASRLGMSRTPVREALVRLENEGFVELTPRRGMRVAMLSVRDIKEISELLAVLETEAAERLASIRLPAEVLAQFDAAIAAMDRALEAKDIDAWNNADYGFHMLLIHACGNRHLIEVAQRFLERANRYRVMTSAHRAPPVYSNVNHAAVVEAIRRGDPQSAAEIHRSHKRRWMSELDGILARLDNGQVVPTESAT